MKNKIFISHSSEDLTIVESFVENILRLGLNIPRERIFCSSIEGQGVESGEYIPDRLKKEIKESSIALLFISKAYKKSEVCLNEIGAAWISLPKKWVIPLLLPDVDFKDLGFLDLNRLGRKIDDASGLLGLIQEKKARLNQDISIPQVFKQITNFTHKIASIQQPTQDITDAEADDYYIEMVNCFGENLDPFDDILRQSIPTKGDGIYEIKDQKTQNKILSSLSKSDGPRTLWYKHAGGDNTIKNLKRIEPGIWLITPINWEIKVSKMWVSMDIEHQYDFILIHSDLTEPFKVTSDIGGEDYDVGILSNGIIVSKNEMYNGYAQIDGETVDISKIGFETRHRDRESHWIFLVSAYHKIGYNSEQTFDFCEKLDSGDIKTTEENIMNFLSSLLNHPSVSKYR